ncbi:hypothetical protein VTL71DRAFT_10732 [Oculimacula yallundae]|uniref:Uncharacterized protein n=1 Tax=Oculimacula yallundae TaxID=86028 RepID=A0ABR4CUH2_9HELO
MSDGKSKAEIIAERLSNLEKPEEPPVASDWDSANPNINVKAGERQEELSNSEVADTGLETGAASQGSGVREEGGADLSKVGREGKDGLDGPPKDAKAK